MSSFKTDKERELEHPIQDKTSVSFDLQTSRDERPGSTLEKDLKANLLAAEADNIIKAYQGLAKGRIIGLQQEMHFHAHLIGRMVREAVRLERGENPAVDQGFQQGVDNALLELNKKVIQLQAKALENAYVQAKKKTPFNEDKFKRVLKQQKFNLIRRLCATYRKI